MTPLKVRFLRPNKVFRAQKSFLGPQKTQKIDFLKKLELYDLAAHSLGLPQYPVTTQYNPSKNLASKKFNHLKLRKIVRTV